MIYLMAILKPAQEMEFFKVMRFMPQRVIMFRELMRRKNIKYRVVVIEDRGGGGNSGGSSYNRRAANVGRKRVKSGSGGVKVNKEGEEEGEEEEDDGVIEKVCEIMREWIARHQEGKVIIYGRTIKRVQRIAKELGCPAYWRGAGDRKAKAEMVEKWISSRGGESGWMAAINALGLGVNDPNVRLVVYGGMPRQLVNFV